MKTILLLLSLSFSGYLFSEDPIMYPNLLAGNFFISDRDPTATEPDFNSTLTLGPYVAGDFAGQTYWYNTAGQTYWDFTGGTNGSFTWRERGQSTKIFSAVTTTLNSSAQISTTKNVQVSYPVDIQVSSLLLGNASGTAYLVYADTASCTTSTTIVAQGTNSTSGVLSLVNLSTVNLSGIIPAGKYACVRTVTNSGTVSFTAKPGQQVQL